MNKIKLGVCPYCENEYYNRSVSEDVNCYDVPYTVIDCSCDKCSKCWTEYFTMDEVKFDLEDEEDIVYNNSLGKDDKEVLLKALNLLVDKEGDKTDYTRIFNILNGELNKE